MSAGSAASAGAEVFDVEPRVAVACGCRLGEGPIWDGRTGTLLWIDIKGKALWRWRPDEGRAAEATALADMTAFVRLTPTPDILLLGTKSGLVRHDLGDGSAILLLAPEPDRPANRLNDADVGPDGTLYFGTMDDRETEETGAFYRWTPQGLDRFGVTAVVTNGPTIDPDRRLLYAADTSRGRVYRHSLDPAGQPGPPEPFVAFGPDEGHPDGITVDGDGHVWIAHFGGGRVTRFAPDGRPVLVVPIPTAKVTKLAFGGPTLETAFVTTAAIGQDREADPLAGHLFAFEPGIRGRAAALWEPLAGRATA